MQGEVNDASLIYIPFIQYQCMFQPTEDILLVFLIIVVHTLMKLSNPSKFAMVINSTTTSNITGFNTHAHTRSGI